MTETSATIHTCKNCGTEYQGSFCPNCGQKLITKRYTLKESLLSFINSIVNVDRGLWHTSINLLIKPGQVIRDVLGGKTVTYLHPFRYLIIWLTLQTFLTINLGLIERLQDVMPMANQQAISAEQAEFQQKFYTIYIGYMNAWLALMIPFYSFGTWVAFRKHKLNYAEHLIVTAYIFGQTSLIGILIIPLYYLPPALSFAMYISFALLLIYPVYAFYSLKRENILVLTLKSLLAILLWVVSISLIVIIIAIATVFITKAGS